ncbi:MAG TPA: ribosome biogenesis GTP-binding protein YihA/YsxC [Ignavibacteriaceae bacterium]|jgi:GTP-binding protein
MYKQIKFTKSVYDLKILQKSDLPEIILCGRSNVGKSSFINSLFNKKGLAKSSSTPGKTRSINFYLVENKFYLIDLPGYGYARSSLKEREKWGNLISEFIKKSTSIFHAFHIIDSRHTPTELDIQLNQFLKSVSIPFTFILSKSDKLNLSELSKAGRKLIEIFPEAKLNENLFLYSAESGKYRSAIFKRLQYLFSHL